MHLNPPGPFTLRYRRHGVPLDETRPLLCEAVARLDEVIARGHGVPLWVRDANGTEVLDEAGLQVVDGVRARDGRDLHAALRSVGMECAHPSPGPWVQLEVRPVMYGRDGGDIVHTAEPTQRELWRDGVEVGRAYVPATLWEKPMSEWYWIAVVGDRHTSAPDLDDAVAGLGAWLTLLDVDTLGADGTTVSPGRG